MKNETSPARRPLTRFTSSLCCVGLASLVASACSFDSGTEDLGSTDVISQDLDTPVDEPFYTSPSEFAGRWVGIADDQLAVDLGPGESAPTYRFPSGGTNIVLDLEFRDNPNVFPNVSGTISFGSGEPPPPPTDPNVGYPVGLSYSELLSYEEDPSFDTYGDGQTLPPLEGFVYSISEIGFGDSPLEDLADGVMRLIYSTGEYLEPWCALQTPVPDGSGGFACLPPYDQFGSDDAGQCYIGQQDTSTCPPNIDELPFEEQSALFDECLVVTEQPVDCDKAFLCSGFSDGPDVSGRCACDITGCHRNGTSTVFSDSAILTLRRNGDELVGILTDALFLNSRGLRVPLGTVRFQRAP